MVMLKQLSTWFYLVWIILIENLMQESNNFNYKHNIYYITILIDDT